MTTHPTLAGLASVLIALVVGLALALAPLPAVHAGAGEPTPPTTGEPAAPTTEEPATDGSAPTSVSPTTDAVPADDLIAPPPDGAPVGPRPGPGPAVTAPSLVDSDDEFEESEIPTFLVAGLVLSVASVVLIGAAIYLLPRRSSRPAKATASPSEE